MKGNLWMNARLALAAAMVGGLLAGCTIGNVNMVRGSGNVITEERAVSGVSEVLLAMSGDLSIEQTGTEALTVEAEDNIVPLITTEVSGDKLTIGTKVGSSFSSTKAVNIRLSVKDLSYIGASASGSVVMQKINSDKLKIETTGSGSITVNGITANACTVAISGSGSITTSGTADNQQVTGSGSGSYKGENLQSKNATVNLSASGQAFVRVSDALDASVSGSGSIRYIGDPIVNKTESGSGRVVQQTAR